MSADRQHPVLSNLEGFFLRWIAATALVFATYNPSHFHYLYWLKHADYESAPFLVFTGLVLLIGYAIFLRATWHSIGLWGILLASTLIGSLIWSLAHLKLLDFSNHNVLIYSVMLTIATIMAIGLDWSILRRTLTGQVDVES